MLEDKGQVDIGQANYQDIYVVASTLTEHVC
jgi:hypothetical protein